MAARHTCTAADNIQTVTSPCTMNIEYVVNSENEYEVIYQLTIEFSTYG